jgi:hypothetical protein
MRTAYARTFLVQFRTHHDTFDHDTEGLNRFLEQLELAQSETAQRGWAYLIRYIYFPENTAQAELLLEAAEKSTLLCEVMAFWLKASVLDAKETISIREAFLANKHYAE